MKTMYLIFGLLVALMTGCQLDKTREFMPGTYVNSAGGKYSQADDTLLIVPAQSNNYLIERRTGFNRITDGIKGKREYEKESWNAIYDEGTKALQETRLGKLITFYPDSAFLKVGKRVYNKLAE
ncbi:hypothetical protein WAE58_04480 [Pedobacter panaciterrae]|uniref:Uncharacterized protein n=1 Tax=Pedobacter panaciterrae TaxID=363849 RepID=A0ABU8NHF5_9SPHI